jgi:hypothetical protein
VGQFRGPGGTGPVLECGGVGLIGLQKGGEPLDQAQRGGDLRAGRGELAETFLLTRGEVVGPGQQQAGGSAG